MRRFATALILLTLSTLTALANADDAPKRSPELQVLDRFVGIWDVEVIVKPAEGEEVTFEVVSHRSWTLGGTFVRIEDDNKLRRPEANEFQMLWTYDPVEKNYPAVVMDGPNRAEVTGTWDAKTTTMHWKGKGEDGGTSEGKHRFIGKDRAEASCVFKDADGKFVMEVSWPQTRRQETTKPSDVSVDEIVAKHLAAMGGDKAVKKLTTRKRTLTLTVLGGDPLKVTVLQKTPNLGHVTTEVPNVGVVTEGFDGKVAWKREPGKEARQLAGDELKNGSSSNLVGVVGW